MDSRHGTGTERVIVDPEAEFADAGAHLPELGIGVARRHDEEHAELVLHTQFEHGPLSSVRHVRDEVEHDVQLLDCVLVGDVVRAPRRRFEGVLDGDGDWCGRDCTRPVRGRLEQVGTRRVAMVDVERLGDEVVRAGRAAPVPCPGRWFR